jgi:conjugative transfer region protein TrbK
MSRSLIGKGLMLGGAAMIVVLIVIGTIGDISRDGQEKSASPPLPNATPNFQQSELLRCQTLGESATTDAACLALWAETRRRFLTPLLLVDEGG